MEKSEELPRYSVLDQHPHRQYRRRNKRRLVKAFVLAFLGYAFWARCSFDSAARRPSDPNFLSVERLEAQYRTCANLNAVPQDPSASRERNARYVNGQTPILIRNATVWIGEPAPGTSAEEAFAGIGYTWIRSDVFIENGLIMRVESDIPESDLPTDCEIFNALGRQLTAGIVDMHSHTGVMSLPDLQGSSDDNELSSDITPYVRSIDGLNPLDPQIQVIKSGGVTTSLILPGSGNNMGGEAFVIKHSVGKSDGRLEISAQDMLADPEQNWRYMKMACGENPKRIYGRVGRDFGPFSRLGEAWYFRHAFEEATKLKNAQDDWCSAAANIGAQNMQTYLPENLRWESLTAVLRGQVLVNTHCYTVPDLEAYVRHTNEFKFSVRAFHHAHQTFLVPEILKRAYGDQPPAAALFADNMNYKAESYIASEQAGKILYESGITPVYVSDNPVLNAQHVVLEAAKAHKNGLPYHVALAGVTSAPAGLLGLGNRIGKVKAGFDADIAVWDSDPLSLGAAPVQVFIDGTPQFETPVELNKTQSSPQKSSDKVIYQNQKLLGAEGITLTGISKIFNQGWEQTFAYDAPANVVIKNGSIMCIGECTAEMETTGSTIHLNNGHISPPLTAFGSFLGLEEIQAEPSTQDGENDGATFSSAVDALSFEGKNLHAAYAHGVTKAISAPKFKGGGHKGVSAGFRIGAAHALEKHAIFDEHVAVHYTFTPAIKQEKTPTLSSAISDLRAKLLKASHGKEKTETMSIEDQFIEKVVAGKIPLVITVHSADIIASLLRLKAEIQSTNTTTSLRMVIIGGAESHLLAHELAAAKVGVVLAPMLAYSYTWDQRRSLTGAPLTNGTAIDVLHSAGVKVAIGVQEDYEARDLMLLAGIAYANGGGRISASDALAFVSKNIYDMLGLEEGEEDKEGRMSEFVVHEGDPLTIDSQVRVVADGGGKVSLWE